MKNSVSTRELQLFSISEVAWLLGLDNSQVCRAIRLGRLPVVRRRRQLLVPAHALTHLADNGDPCADPQVAPVVRGDAG